MIIELPNIKFWISRKLTSIPIENLFQQINSVLAAFKLPRDSSAAFGQQFVDHVLPEILKENSTMIKQASVTKNGKLGPHFE